MEQVFKEDAIDKSSSKILFYRFILHQIHLQCTEKVEKSSLDKAEDETGSSSDTVSAPGPGPSTDWSRSSPSKRMSESSVTSGELHDMANVLDRSGQGDKSLQEEVSFVFVSNYYSHLNYLNFSPRRIPLWETCWECSNRKSRSVANVTV